MIKPGSIGGCYVRYLNFSAGPTRKEHDKSPVAVAIGNWVHGAEIVENAYRVLEVKPECGYTERTVWKYLRSVKAIYHRNKELVALNSGKRTTVGSGGFFVYRGKDYAAERKDLKEILLLWPICFGKS